MAKKIKEVDVDEDLTDLDETEVKAKKEKKPHFTIEEHDFKMVSSRASDVRFFDFYYLHTVNKGKDNERQEFKLEGYGFRLETCIKRIASMRAGVNVGQRKFNSMKEFLMFYQKQLEETKKLFDMLPQNFD